MSGECEDCGEHSTECKWGIGCDSPGSQIKEYSLKPDDRTVDPYKD